MEKGVKMVFRTVFTLVVLLSVAIGVVLNFVFTPSKLTPKVEQLARNI